MYFLDFVCLISFYIFLLFRLMVNKQKGRKGSGCWESPPLSWSPPKTMPPSSSFLKIPSARGDIGDVPSLDSKYLESDQ